MFEIKDKIIKNIEIIWAFLFYLALGTPIATPYFNFNTSNSLRDALGMTWVGWFMKGVVDGNFRLTTDLLWYPRGVDMTTSIDSYLYIIIYYLFGSFTNGIFINNIVILLFFALNGTTLFYVLRRYFHHKPLASFIGSAIYAFSPYFISRGDKYLNLLAGFSLPLILMFCFQYKEKPNIWSLVKILSGLLLAVLSSYIYFFYSILLLFVFSLVFGSRQLLKVALGIYGGVLVFMFFFFGYELFVPRFSFWEQTSGAARVFSFVSPRNMNMEMNMEWLSKFLKQIPIIGHYASTEGASVFFGYIELGFIFLFLWRARIFKLGYEAAVKYKKLIIIGAVFLVLSLGPILYMFEPTEDEAVLGASLGMEKKVILPYGYTYVYSPL